MYSGQDANSGIQPVMSPQQPIVSSGGPVILAPDVDKPKRWPIVVVAILFLAAIGIGVAVLIISQSKPVVKDVVDAYIEYFVYGTEGGENQIDIDTFEIDPSEYAVVEELQNPSAEESTEYFDKLYNKFEMVETKGKKEIDADLLKYNGIYLEYYKTAMQTLDSDFLLDFYEEDKNLKDLYNNLTIENTGLLRSTYDALKNYAREKYDFYASVEKIGCLIDGEVDDNCIWENNGDYWRTSIASTTISDLNRCTGLIYNSLVDNLKEIYEQGARDEQ